MFPPSLSDPAAGDQQGHRKDGAPGADPQCSATVDTLEKVTYGVRQGRVNGIALRKAAAKACYQGKMDIAWQRARHHIKMSPQDAGSVCLPTPRCGVQAVGIKVREAKNRTTWFGPASRFSQH